MKYAAGVQGRSFLLGTEYEIFSGELLAHMLDHNAVCAVCMVRTRSMQIMIPATYECPSGWTREYYGYLMTETHANDRTSKTYIYLDKDPESIPGSSANTSPAVMYHVEGGCNGLPCPPYSAEKELTCAVCSY